MVACQPCGCIVPTRLLAQHTKGRKHIQNTTANEIPNSSTVHKPPLSSSDQQFSQPVSLQITSSPAIGTSDSRVVVSHEDGLDFEVEGTDVAGQPSFPPAVLTILIEKTEVVSSLSISAVNLFLSPGTSKSCVKVSVSGEAVQRKKPCKILVSFQAPHAGTFRLVLHLVFSDNTRPSDKAFAVSRELRGVATLSSRHVGSAHPQGPFFSSRVDDHAALPAEEKDLSLDGQGVGISVSKEDGVDFGIVKRNGLKGSFNTATSLVTINHAKGSPVVTLVETRIESCDGSDSSSSFRATFKGGSRTINPGTKCTVEIEFIPEFEGQFEATLKLIFMSKRLGRFAISRKLEAIAGSLEVHKRFESFDQEKYIPPCAGQQISRNKVIPLLIPPNFGNIPEYELPALVQEAVDRSTFKRPYTKKAPSMIAILKPTELTMGTYAEYFTALLNIEEGHQQREILDHRPFKVEVQTRDSRYFIEFENKEEDLLPELLKGDFVWLEDTRRGVYFDARITNADIFVRGSLVVLKVFLQVPGSFNLHRGAQFLLRLRHNRTIFRRQYHALASSLAQLRRVLFPSTSDMKSIQRLSETEIVNLPLVNEEIGKDKQQLHAVVSILQQPKGSVPFIIFGPPGTGKTSTVVESIMQLVRRDPISKILACTPSNAAADLLVERLAAAGLAADQLLRLNARSRDIRSIPESVRPFSDLPKPAKLRTYRVVLSTCSSAALLQKLKIRAGHFSHIIIDEAAQVDEPLALVPIAFFSNKDTNVILAGDPNQLGPVIKSGPASEAGLGKSYLERLMNISKIYGLDSQAGDTIVGLQRNRRSHGAIIAWPNRYMYEDIMRADASPDVSHALLRSDVLPKQVFPVLFYGIKGQEQRTKQSPSYLNLLEASVVRDYCLKLVGDCEHKIYANEIGVIAPYKAQVRAIRELLRPAGLKDISVGSVEQFQGQERKVIIFATTRSNSEVEKRKAMGFLQSRQRMNVSITRAQLLLVVVGDPEVLGKDELWRTFLNYVRLCGGWVGKAVSWKPEEDVDVPGYKVIPRPGEVMYGEGYIGGKSEKIYRFFS